MLVNNLPAWQVVLPMMGAPLCALLLFRKLAWLFTVLVTWGTFGVSLMLLQQLNVDGQTITYHMGGWQPPFGIEYRIDELTAFMLLLLTGIASITSVYAKASVEAEIAPEKQTTFYAVFLLCYTGLLGMTITNDAFNIYVFLEISSLATYALIAMGKDRRAFMASIEYLILGTIGATFILIAIGLLYVMTGTLNISDLAERVPAITSQTPVKAALAFLVIGLCLKIAMFPLHVWLANAYTNAPSFVASFLSATATKVGIYVLIRVIYTLFGTVYTFDFMMVDKALITLSVVAVLVGSMVAIFQLNIKRMLAYSSIAQIGYIVIGLCLASEMGLTAAIIHMFNHALAKSALFMAAGAMMMRAGGVRLADVKGLGKDMPITCGVFVVAGLSMIGVPLTAGFVTKWALFNAIIEQELWLVFIVLVVSSVMAVIYIWRVVEVLYFSQPKTPRENVKEAPVTMLCGMVIMAALSIVFGVYSQPVMAVAQKAATVLIGGF